MSRRDRWKLLAAFAIILGIGVAACLLIGKAQERTTFFSEVDPKTGDRCRFTLSVGWKLEDTDSDIPDVSRFVAYPMNPLLQWLNRRLLGHPPSGPSSIVLVGHNLAATHLRAGYPDPTLPRGFRVLTQQNLRVDGYPSTLTKFVTSKNVPERELCIYLPGDAKVYAFFGLCETSSMDQVDREMQGIISSFHIEKVAAPGGKR